VILFSLVVLGFIVCFFFLLFLPFSKIGTRRGDQLTMLCYVVVCGHGESPAFKIPGYGQRPYSIWFGISSILGDFEHSPFRKRAHSEH